MAVYEIVNMSNGKRYIGSTNDFKWRTVLHRSTLKRGCHANSHLQYAWRKYGREAFSFNVLEVVAREDDLVAREQVWIDAYPFADLYNIMPTAGRLCSTPDVVARRSLTNTGKKRSAATRLLLSQLAIGRKHTDGAKAKMSASAKRRGPTNTGCHWPNEMKARISATLKQAGVKPPSRLGCKDSIETRQLKSLRLREYHQRLRIETGADNVHAKS